jgi:3-Oxoacyl-[acyl-carrier-protein (ACP)] synthase III C terminal/3-Oxoacyl-[acyl-carrier-protein (ACP)] synthase III
VKPFVINRHGRLVFPANFFEDLDFSVLETLDQFTAVIGRDFEAKAPTGTDILVRVESGAYPGRFELLRDLGQNLYWVNRYSITLFDKRPTRWRDLAKRRDDVFLPVVTPWQDSERKVAAVERAFRALPATWDADTENRVFDLLFDVFRTKLHHATELPPIKPTVAEFGERPDALTFVMPAYDPDYPVFRTEDIVDAHEVRRPVLLVCVEKFSDKIGSVRTSRMIFGDGAAAMVIAPAAAGDPGDVEVVQTYASGPHSEVNSIIWPNAEFDNDITVYGPEVKSLAQRYLVQMLDELGALPDPDGPGRTLLEGIELIVPHQANKTMILNLAGKAGLSADQLYFNVDKMGNVSAASIPIAVYDAVRDGVISRPTRIFAPGFGAGAVGGYAVMHIDPAIMADEVVLEVLHETAAPPPTAGGTMDDMRAAFGG